MAESPVTYSGVPTETTAEMTSVAIPVSESQPFPANVASFHYPTPAEAAAGPMKSSLTLQSFSNTSFVVVGDSKPYRSHLKEAGGEWNKNLRTPDGRTLRAWIFPLDRQDQVKNLIERINRGEVERDKPQPYHQKRPYQRHSNMPSQSINLPASVPIYGRAAPVQNAPTRPEWYKPRMNQRGNMRIRDKNTNAFQNFGFVVNQLFSSRRTGVVNGAQIIWDDQSISQIHVIYDGDKDKLVWRVKDFAEPHSIGFY